MAHIFDAHHMMFTGDEAHHISNHSHAQIYHPLESSDAHIREVGGAVRRFFLRDAVIRGHAVGAPPVAPAGMASTFHHRHWTHGASGRTLRACARGALVGGVGGAAAGGVGGAVVGAGGGCAAGIVKEGLRQIGKQIGK